MVNFFREDTHLGIFVTTVADLLVLNLLWLLGCLPIITIGTSTTALYQCLIERQKEKTLNVFSAFWSAFKSNFKKSTILFLLVAAIVCLLAFDAYLVFFTQVGENGFILLFFVFVLFQTLPASGYIFPLQAYFESGVLQTLKNAWVMSFVHFPTSVCVLVLNLVPVLFCIFFPSIFVKSIMVWILGGSAAIAYLNTILLQRVFRKYALKS